MAQAHDSAPTEEVSHQISSSQTGTGHFTTCVHKVGISQVSSLERTDHTPIAPAGLPLLRTPPTMALARPGHAAFMGGVLLALLAGALLELTRLVACDPLACRTCHRG